MKTGSGRESLDVYKLPSASSNSLKIKTGTDYEGLHNKDVYQLSCASLNFLSCVGKWSYTFQHFFWGGESEQATEHLIFTWLLETISWTGIFMSKARVGCM